MLAAGRESLDRVSALPDSWLLVLSHEIAAGQVVIERRSFEPYEGASLVLDLATGEVVADLDGLRPALRHHRFYASPSAAPLPGSLATRLFTCGCGALVEVDPETYKVTTLLGEPGHEHND